MRRSLASLVLACLVWACSTLQVGSDSAPGIDFSSYRSFALAPAPTDQPRGLVGYSAITAEEIRREIGAVLEGKGLRREGREGADLLVAFSVSGEPRSQVWGTSGWGWYGGAGHLRTMNYIRGQLTINVYDVARQKLVWHGWATEELFESRSGGTPIAEVVAATLAQFPPEES